MENRIITRFNFNPDLVNKFACLYFFFQKEEEEDKNT